MKSALNMLMPALWIALVCGTLFLIAAIPTNGRDPLTGIQFHRQSK
jgi:hypothetical protein